jgi:hypothetical protein
MLEMDNGSDTHTHTRSTVQAAWALIQPLPWRIVTARNNACLRLKLI